MGSGHRKQYLLIGATVLASQHSLIEGGIMKTFLLAAVAAATLVAGVGLSSTDGVAQKKSAAPPKVLILFKGQNFEGQSYEVVKLRTPII
jgi:hypothetical protein